MPPTAPTETAARPARAVAATTLVRLALPDRPGGLALVTRCLAACGVDILEVEVLGHRDGTAVDDFLVRGGDVERALTALEPEVVLLGKREGRRRRDAGLLMGEALVAIFSADSRPAAREALVASALPLVGADDSILFTSRDGATLTPVAATTGALPTTPADEPAIARRVLRNGKRLAGPCTASWAASTYGAAVQARHLACVPAPGEAGVLLVARRDDFPFAETEVERLEALTRAVARHRTP